MDLASFNPPTQAKWRNFKASGHSTCSSFNRLRPVVRVLLAVPLVALPSGDHPLLRWVFDRAPLWAVLPACPQRRGTAGDGCFVSGVSLVRKTGFYEVHDPN